MSDFRGKRGGGSSLPSVTPCRHMSHQTHDSDEFNDVLVSGSGQPPTTISQCRPASPTDDGRLPPSTIGRDRHEQTHDSDMKATDSDKLIHRPHDDPVEWGGGCSLPPVIRDKLMQETQLAGACSTATSQHAPYRLGPNCSIYISKLQTAKNNLARSW